MSATDELRRLLDERCIEWSDDGFSKRTSFTSPVSGARIVVLEDMNGKLVFGIDYSYVTLEQVVEMTLGREKCCYIPDEQGYRWQDDNGEWHEEEDSAAYGCSSASCDKCGYTMMVGDDGWFYGYDEPKEWTDEDGKKHCGFVLEPIFKFCPECGREVER